MRNLTLVVAATYVLATAVVATLPAVARQGGPVGQAAPPGIEPVAPSPPAGAAPDAASVARGTALYEGVLNCAACHGTTGRGGPNNSPDLTRSALAMQPDGGRGLAAFLRVGRPEKGMPAAPVPLTDQQASDLSAKLRALGFAAAPQAPSGGRAGGRGGQAGLPLALAGQQLSTLVGDPALGRKYFNGPVGQCSRCHSVVDGQRSSAANLAHIAIKYPDPMTLQINMLLNRGNNWYARMTNDITATLTYSNGRVVTGYLSSISDFKIFIHDETGKDTEIVRTGDEPKVVLVDRLQHHLDLLERYSDNDIHNLTAYLATLK